MPGNLLHLLCPWDRRRRCGTEGSGAEAPWGAGPLVTAQAERGKAGQGRNPTSWVWNEKVSAIEFPRTGLSAPANVHIGRDELRGTQEAWSC